MNDKQQILTTLRDEFDHWEAFLSRLREEQITAPCAPEKLYNRSVKDVLAHLMAWQKRTLARLQAAQEHREPDFSLWPSGLDPEAEEDLDAVNTWIYGNTRDRAWEDVHREWREGFLRLLAIGETLPESDLLERNRYSWLPGYSLADVLLASCEHHQEHREPLLTWLQERGSDAAS